MKDLTRRLRPSAGCGAERRGCSAPKATGKQQRQNAPNKMASVAASALCLNQLVHQVYLLLHVGVVHSVHGLCKERQTG